MSDAIPVAEKRRTSYENFVAECPWCGRECIFNRVSDLRTVEPIGGLDVSCLNDGCGKPFRLVGDTVNERHEMLIYDCYELLERKHYMNCILNLAQAYEVFFGLFLRVELLYKPFAADPDRDIADLNRVSEELVESLKEQAFCGMRALFLRQIVAQRSPADLAESAAIIAAFPPRPGEPKDTTIDALRDAKLVALLKALKATTIHSFRNRVVHKHAYRPSREQVQVALEETRSILFPLANRLGIHDDVNWYMRHAQP